MDSSEMAKIGARARAVSLAPAKRSEIARAAALARWGDHGSRVATHAGKLQIGDITIDCAVLPDEKGSLRVMSQSAVLGVLGRHPEKSRRAPGPGGELRAPFLLAENLQPFISDELVRLSEPIPYRFRGVSGRSQGYRAEVLPMVCEVYLAARAAGKLTTKQEEVAAAAELIIRGLARVGVVALVDEATGFQETRARDELQRILDAYVQPELRSWTKRFPDEFFRQVYRLNGWEFREGTAKRTPYVGKLINRYIYEQLPPGVLDELRRLNPKTTAGYRVNCFHQFMTADTGNQHLDRQISTVTTLMRVADDKNHFQVLFDKAYPQPEPQTALIVNID